MKEIFNIKELVIKNTTISNIELSISGSAEEFVSIINDYTEMIKKYNSSINYPDKKMNDIEQIDYIIPSTLDKALDICYSFKTLVTDYINCRSILDHKIHLACENIIKACKKLYKINYISINSKIEFEFIDSILLSDFICDTMQYKHISIYDKDIYIDEFLKFEKILLKYLPNELRCKKIQSSIDIAVELLKK